MIREKPVARLGLEYILIGEGGTGSYLLLLAFISLLSLCRAFQMRGGRGRGFTRGILAGFVLLVLSRALRISSLPSVDPGYGILTSGAGLAGLYLLAAAVSAGSRSEDYGLWNPRIVLSAVGSGILLGGGMLATTFSAISGAAVFGGIHIFCSMAPIGLVCGTAYEQKRLRNGLSLPLYAGLGMIAAANIIAGLKMLSVAGQGIYWDQLLRLADMAGFSLLLAGLVLEKSEKTVEEKIEDMEPAGLFQPALALARGEAAAGLKMVEISRKTAAGRRAQEIYRDITKTAAEESGADFVILRTVSEQDGKFEVKSYVNKGDAKTIPGFSIALRRNGCARHLTEDRACGGGYVLDRDSLGDESGAFVPMDLEWKKGVIFIYPVKEKGVIQAIFTAGFFPAEVEPGVSRVFEFLANNAADIIAREGYKEKIRRKEKALAICKEELESANQLKSNFLSIVSHELRTPLTSVKAYTETLIDNVDTIKRETIQDFLKVMNEENERVIKLVDNILNYSCMETGHLKVDKTRCNLNEIITEVHQSLAGSFSEKLVDSELKLPRIPVQVDADRELIRQLLNNLMSNAVKFSPEKGKVTVTLEEEASSARIIVQDNGRGIPEDQLEKIFERFHQADGSNTREYGGSGLGLAICKNIVEWHDGRIWVENVKEAGAKFVVILPMKDVVVRQSAGEGFIGSIRFERDRYITLLVEMLAEFLQARKASIMLLDKKGKKLRIVAAKGLDPEFVQNTKLEAGDRIAGRVLLEGEQFHVYDIEKDGKIGRKNNSSYYGTNSFISTPLRVDGEVIGVLNVSDHVENREFTKADAEILESLGQVMAGMLKKLEAYEMVSANFEKLKDAMKSILHIREGWGSRNLLNYTLIALAVGERLNLDEKALTALRIGMNIYDLGMMKVPRSIRVKKEELSSKEWAVLKEHPEIGYSLISPMGLEERVMKIVKSHHEYFDGSGYPEGLVREEIPIEARIINVVDSFRALITEGPYRRCFTLDEARNEIIKNSGKKFDPKVVGAFVKALHDLGAREEKCEFILDSVERELEEKRKETKNTEGEKAVKEEV